MNVKTGIIKPLQESGITLYEPSDFVRDNGKTVIYRGAGSSVYSGFACSTNGLNKDLPVTIKLLRRLTEDISLASERADKDLVLEKTWQDFQRECCVRMRAGKHPYIQEFIGVVKTGFFECDAPGMVCKDVAVGDLYSFAFSNDERATIRMRLKLMQDVASGLAHPTSSSF